MIAQTNASIWEGGGKTEGFDGRRMRFFALSLSLFASQKSSSRTAVLGPSAALTVHWTVIHYRVARYANLPEGAKNAINPTAR